MVPVLALRNAEPGDPQPLREVPKAAGQVMSEAAREKAVGALAAALREWPFAEDATYEEDATAILAALEGFVLVPLNGLRELSEAAPDGPWHVEPSGGFLWRIRTTDGPPLAEALPNTADFIVACERAIRQALGSET